MQRSIEAGRLLFTDDSTEAFDDAEIIFICVGTPTAEDGNCDLTGVLSVAHNIADFISNHPDQHPLVVVKSTVPVGTTEQIAQLIERSTNTTISIANNLSSFVKEARSMISDNLTALFVAWLTSVQQTYL